MTDDIDLKKIKALSVFQRKFRFYKKELDLMTEEITFLKDILVSMIVNLSFLNNYNIFSNTDNHNQIILEELRDVKNLFDKIPDKLIIKNLNDNTSDTLIEIKQLIIKFMNHISPENLSSIFNIFDNEWRNHFDKDDIVLLEFLIKFFKPVCVWHSKNHNKEIVLNKKKQISKPLITKDIIESLIKEKKDINTSIIISDNNVPNFLKSINEIVKKNTKNVIERKNHYSKMDCITTLGVNNFCITKNKDSISLIEDKFGACLYLKLGSGYLVIQGLFKDDLLDISKTIPYIKEKYNIHKKHLNYELIVVPKNFRNNYIQILNLRDLFVNSSVDLLEDCRKKYNDYKQINSKPLLTLINEFIIASKYRKIDVLSLLLMNNDEDKKLAFILYDIFKTKDKKKEAIDIYNSLHHTLRDYLDFGEDLVKKDDDKLNKLTNSDIPYERRISLLKADDDVKSKALDKLKSIKSSFQGDNKAQSWLDGVLKIPFGIYKENSIMSFKDEFIKKLNLDIKTNFEVEQYINTLAKDDKLSLEWNEYKENKLNYIKDIRKTLDNAVYGHKEAKLQLERIFAQWINGKSKGAIIGLQGPPGTGKTSLAKNGLSKCLKDNDNENRPFVFLPIGGSVNGSTLVGHNYTYVGSTWGRIADGLMTSKCMNPIIFIDELDKVSNTEHGKEIISILTHLTDLTQNDEFEDKYFSGIKLDLSKALIVFSFNDINLIDPILKDRITIIETKPLTLPEKLVIIQKYMLPEIFSEVGFNTNELIFSDKIIEFIINTYTNEAGVRKVKEKLIEIVRDINLSKFHNDNITLPYTIQKEYIEQLFENKPKIRIKKINKEPQIGLVNGLYATTTGVGGLTVIQAMKYPADKLFELSLTGKQGDVMKESVNYALKLAYNLCDEEVKNKFLEKDFKKFGIHVHTPEAATPKDGPSAGAAMTLAIYSLLNNKKVNNELAMTGEIDLCGNITAIGGVPAKLNGAKKAGAKIALIPQDNLEDLQKLRKDNISPEDNNFKVITVSHINEVLELAF